MPTYESYVTNDKKCRAGELSVTRRGFNRGGKQVKGTSYCATDRGKPGRGPKKIPTPHKGSLGGPGYTSRSADARHRLLRKHIKNYGYASTVSSLQSRINLGHRTMSAGALKVFEVDKRWVQRTFGGSRNLSPKKAAAAGRGARMQPLQTAWDNFLRIHGMNRFPLNRSFPGIKVRVVARIKDGGVGGPPDQDELDYSKASLGELVALARSISKDPDATAAQARQAAKYATELADIKSRVGRVTINPSSKKERNMATTSTRNGPRAKRKRRAEGRQAPKRKSGGSGLTKARAIRGAMSLGVSKDTANRLYDAGKLTDTGHPKKGARDVPKGMKAASKKKKAPAKKKKAKKKTKAVAKRKTKKVAKRKSVKRAPPRPRRKAKKGPRIKVKRRGSAPTVGCRRGKKGSQSLKSAAQRVQSGKEGRSGTPLAYERWCRNFQNVEKYSEEDLADLFPEAAE